MIKMKIEIGFESLLEEVMRLGKKVEEVNKILSQGSVSKEEVEDVRWARKEKEGKIKIYMKGEEKPITVVSAEIKFSNDMVKQIVKESYKPGRMSVLKPINFAIEYVRSGPKLMLRDRVGDIPLEKIEKIEIETKK